MAVPDAEEFAGTAFWPRAERLLDDLLRASSEDGSLIALGRLFYLADAPADAAGTAAVLASTRAWLGEVLRVGRRDGAVRDDLPADLQGRLVFAILRTFDEWSVANWETLPPAELRPLVRAQLDTVRRILAPS